MTSNVVGNLKDKNWLESKISRLKDLKKRAKSHDKKKIQARITTFESCLNDINSPSLVSDLVEVLGPVEQLTDFLRKANIMDIYAMIKLVKTLEWDKGISELDFHLLKKAVERIDSAKCNY